MSNHKISIAINTCNRKESYFECLSSVVSNTDIKDNLFVVDDASKDRYAYFGHYFHDRVGISTAKNMALKMCYESGADHIFLLDDDVRILKHDWWKPYVESGEHHLCATFLPQHRSFKKLVHKPSLNDPISPSSNYDVYEVELKTHLLGNGYCLYFTRHCIETVGGFDTNFKNKYEHVNLSQRICNAGLTKYPFQDVVHSDKLIYCLDQDNAIQRSFTEREMQDNLKSGYDYFRSQANSKEYIEFRT